MILSGPGKSTKKTSTRRNQLHFETLEHRRLMAADVNLLNGVLTIQGDSSNDWVEVDSIYKTYAFYEGKPGQFIQTESDFFLEVKLGHTKPDGSHVIDKMLDNFGTKTVDQILFYGGAGNDYFYNNTAIASDIYGQSGIDHLYGGDAGDRLYGGSYGDFLYGGKGDDELFGGSGDDELYGGKGDDTLNGLWGSDLLHGDEGLDHIDESVYMHAVLNDDSLVYTYNSPYSNWSWSWSDSLDSVETATLTGNGFANELDASAFTMGGVTLRGEGGNDTLIGTSQMDVLSGGTGSDLIDGRLGNDRLDDNVAGNVQLSNTKLTMTKYRSTTVDTLTSIEGATLKGSDGNDDISALSFSAGSVTIYGNGGNDTLTGTYLSDHLYGQKGNDILNGKGGNDYLHGNEGDDNLYGNSGTDTYYGGSGYDHIADTIPGRVFISDLKMTITPSSGGDTFIEGMSSIEKVTLAGDSNQDIFFASSFSGDILFYGLGGDDILHGGLGDDLIYGGSGDDRLFGGKGNDNLRGGPGNDSIHESVAKSAVLKDTRLRQFDGTMDLVEEDELESIEKATLVGGSTDNYLSARYFSGDSILIGNSGDDVLVGGKGTDRFFGGSGKDTAMKYLAGDVLLTNSKMEVTPPSAVGGPATTSTISSIARVEIWGSLHDEVFNASGFSGTVLLSGSGGNDVLIGTNGNDTLHGDAGDDRLVAGKGTDTLYGGDGNDTLVSIDQDTNDVLWGGKGTDSFWLDREVTTAENVLPVKYATDKVKDASNVESDTNMHQVAAFENGADKSLDGDDIADPTDGKDYKNFADLPLFASTGPTQADVRQGQLGDCWLMAGLGAAAKANPNSILQTVVDLGDGTYAVELGGKYYRVDADLPTSSPTSTGLLYAATGQEDSIWVPIVEKAYAYYRYDYLKTNKYSNWTPDVYHQYKRLNGGWASSVFSALGKSGKVNKSFKDGTSALNHISSELGKGKAVVVNIKKAVDNCPCADLHAYVVEKVNFGWVVDAAGNVNFRAVSVVLRNPWGFDGFGNDGNSNDALVTVTASQLAGSMFQNGKGIQSSWLS